MYHDPVKLTVHRSADEGKTWEQVSGPQEGDAARLIEHPHNNEMAFIIGRYSVHWVTYNRGASWQSFETPRDASLTGRLSVFMRRRTSGSCSKELPVKTQALANGERERHVGMRPTILRMLSGANLNSSSVRHHSVFLLAPPRVLSQLRSPSSSVWHLIKARNLEVGACTAIKKAGSFPPRTGSPQRNLST